MLAWRPPHKVGDALGVERVVNQEIEPLALQLAATPTVHAAYLELQIYPGVAARQIANAPGLAIVPTRMHATAEAAQCFFEPRMSVSTRAFGSPPTARTLVWGRKPGNAYASHSRRCRLPEVAMETSCQNPHIFTCVNTSTGAGLQAGSIPHKLPTQVREEPLFVYLFPYISINLDP
jgi:hypothetical protein